MAALTDAGYPPFIVEAESFSDIRRAAGDAADAAVSQDVPNSLMDIHTSLWETPLNVTDILRITSIIEILRWISTNHEYP